MYKTVEAYTPVTNNWAPIDSAPFPVADNTATVFDNVIYLFGGTSTTLSNITPLSTTFSYKPPRIPAVDVKTRQDITPLKLMLLQNYPNPFNASTKILYSLPTSGLVTLTIYDLLGKEIQTLVNDFQNAGLYSASFNASELSSGIYFYTLQVGNDFLDTKRMLYMK